MRSHIKSRIIALAIRLLVPILSISGSSPQTAATREAVRTVAGPASTAPAQQPSIMVHRVAGGSDLPRPGFGWKSATVTPLTDGLAPFALADAIGLDFIRQCLLIPQAW
jgi:hypothetical protein